MGPPPKHRWRGTRLQFEQPDHTWGEAVDVTRDVVVRGGGGASLADDYTAAEYLAEQSGSGGVLTFTFSAQVQQVWVDMAAMVATDVGRVRVDGGNPTVSLGSPLRDQTPLPITANTATVKVLAPAGSTVNCWGYRR